MKLKINKRLGNLPKVNWSEHVDVNINGSKDVLKRVTNNDRSKRIGCWHKQA